MAFQPGQIVDHYRLDQIVARGRASVVFSATDLRLRRRVAFKALNDDYAADRAFRERFEIESTTAAQLEHPYIVTVYDSNVFTGTLYFVTQFIDGVTLQELLHRQAGGQPLLPAEAMALLEQMSSALDYAHRCGLVHRDVKPGNIMIKMTETPRSAYLIDFGINKRLEADASVDGGGFVGTADYAAPEQIRMEADLDRRADVYSLACTAFEMLVGQAPYASAGDEQQRIDAQLSAPIPSAVSLHSQLPAAVDAVFVKALAKDKVDRYGTCGAMVDALRLAFPADALEYRRAPAPAGAAPAGPVVEPKRRRVKVIAAIAATVLVAAAAVTAFVANRDSDIEAVAGVTTTNPATTQPSTTTAAPSTTVAPSTTAVESTSPTDATTTSPATTEPPPTTVLGPFGDEVGAIVEQPTTAQGATVFALQARRLPSEIANVDTPTFFYAQWLRLATPAATSPITASASGYVIDAGGPADVNQFELGTDGRVLTLTECTAECLALKDAIVIDPTCTPGPNCIAFASDSGGLIAFQRATVRLRSPEVTLLFSFTAPQAVAAVSDATGAVRFDAETGYFSVTLPSAPPDGTESVANITFADGTVSRLTITYG